MSMLDVFEDISAKNVVKSETGDPRIFGVMLGVVTKNYIEGIKGKVCVQVPTRDEEKNEIMWARVAMPSSGETWGHYFLPEIGDEVLLAFEGGNIERPYVIGCIPKEGNKFLSENAKEDNNLKVIQTNSGSFIRFDDGAGKESSKKASCLTIQATGENQTHIIELNNEAGYLKISDKDGKNKVLITTGKTAGSNKGKIEVEAETDVLLKTGDAKIELNGQSNSVTIKANTFTFEANSSVKIKGATVDIEGNNLKIDGQNVKTSGSFVSVEGQVVKVGG
ncbi:MAG: phage baseplate assembly protein V [Clostridia bacterium]|nr:phage baseplate assembly protein V [Clostridia bacterium]